MRQVFANLEFPASAKSHICRKSEGHSSDLILDKTHSCITTRAGTVRQRHKRGGSFHTSWSSQLKGRAVTTTAVLLNHTAGTQSTLRFMSDLHPAGSLQALLTCVTFPWGSRILWEATLPWDLKSSSSSCYSPATCVWAMAAAYRMAPLSYPSCLPSILTFTGNNGNHLAHQIR